MIALGFQSVVVFVLDLPAGAPVPYDVGDVGHGDPVIGGKGVFVSDLAVVPGGGQLAPVDVECPLAIAQRHLIDEAVGFGIVAFSLAAADFQRLDIAGGC